MMDIMINKEVLKALRKEKNWSQEELATAAGLSHRTIQRIEGSGNCSLESKRALSAALDVDIETLSCIVAPSLALQRFQSLKKFALYTAACLFIPLAIAFVTLLLRNSQNTAGFEVVIANPNDVSTDRYQLSVKQSEPAIIKLRDGYSLEVEFLRGITPRLKAQLFHSGESGKQLLHSSNRRGTEFHPVKYLIRPGNDVCYQSPAQETGIGCARS